MRSLKERLRDPNNASVGGDERERVDLYPLCLEAADKIERTDDIVDKLYSALDRFYDRMKTKLDVEVCALLGEAADEIEQLRKLEK